MKHLITFLLLISMQLCAIAQEKVQVNKVRFQSINQIGFIHGEASTEPLIQTINGVQFKTFSAGIGLGLDYYKERSVTIFLDVKKTLLNKPISPFVYVDAGHNFTWVKKQPEDWANTDYKGGLFYDLGFGYQFPAFKKNSFIISVGYSYKEITEERDRNPWMTSFPQQDNREKLDYSLRRYSFKMGLTL